MEARKDNRGFLCFCRERDRGDDVIERQNKKRDKGPHFCFARRAAHADTRLYLCAAPAETLALSGAAAA